VQAEVNEPAEQPTTNEYTPPTAIGPQQAEAEPKEEGVNEEEDELLIRSPPLNQNQKTSLISTLLEEAFEKKICP